MANDAYLSGRKKYSRPQAILWSNSAPVLSNGFYVPEGLEVDQSPISGSSDPIDDFLILSDDNRASLNFSFERIEKRQRMVNGRMRSYHIADKLALATSWEMLPSRSFASSPEFNTVGKPTTLIGSVDHDDDPETSDKPVIPFGSAYYRDQQYTTDGGAGGVELLSWYDNHPGSFWVYLAYDNYNNFENDKYSKLAQYNEAIEMYFASFDYSVQKRGGTSFDFWNISLRLEEA
jgi:hypothetical protein